MTGTGAAGVPPEPGAASSGRTAKAIGGLVLVVLALLGAGLLGIALRQATSGVAAPTLAPVTTAYREFPDPTAAPPLELTDQDGDPFALTSLLGHPVLVYFGYTHCPDVCPTSIGIINDTLHATGPETRAVFTSIDPDRDDIAAMKSYLRYLPAGYVGLSGTPQAIRRAADGWQVQYAKIETGSAGGYAMGHSSDVFLVDRQGRLRAAFPFGTEAAPIIAAIRDLGADTPPSAVASEPVAGSTETPSSALPPTASLYAELVTTSIWAGGQSPVIVTARDATGNPLDEHAAVQVRVSSPDGATTGPAVPAVPVRPDGAPMTFFVAMVDIPSAGKWRLDLADAAGAAASLDITALDPGSTARLGAPAPNVATPTLADVGGDPRWITTVREPDLRLSRTSTVQATAAGNLYVLLIDSAKFETTPACGRALSIFRYLVDRWPETTFIHLEPYEYSVVDGAPVLQGQLSDPPVNRYARAWGMGVPPWPPTAQPWMFVVDGAGVVRAKYTGVMGSNDVEAILALLRDEGR